MWAKFVERINEFDYLDEDSFSILLKDVGAATNGLLLGIELMLEGARDSRWEIGLSNVCESRLTPGAHFDAGIYDDHPLLADFSDHREQLYFRGSVLHPDALARTLIVGHDEEMQHWRPSTDYLNPSIWNAGILSSRSGVFATGPTRLIDAYEATLREHEAFGGRLDHGAPRIWPNSGYEPVPPVRLLLLHNGDERRMTDSYVIAEEIATNRVG